MKNFFYILSIPLILLSSLHSQEKKVFSLQVENDLGFSDRYYTNGIKFNYTSQSDKLWTSYLQFKLLKAIFSDKDKQTFESISFGQDMKVSTNIAQINPPLDDHPYSGWLYVSSGANLASENSLDSFTVTLGLIGPQSYAGDIQRAYHDLIDATEPMGWDTQLKNEPAFILSYNHTQRFLATNLTDSLSFDFLTSLGANLGNKITEGKAKGIFRIGFNLPKSFDINRIEPITTQDIVYNTQNTSNWHFYYYAGVIGRAVGFDICLNGNTIAKSRSVTLDNFVGEAVTGLSARYEDVQIELNWTVQSRTYETQSKDYQMFWTANIKIFF